MGHCKSKARRNCKLKFYTHFQALPARASFLEYLIYCFEIFAKLRSISFQLDIAASWVEFSTSHRTFSAVGVYAFFPTYCTGEIENL